MQKKYDLSLPVGDAKRSLVLDDVLSVDTLLRLNPHWIIESVDENTENYLADLKDYVSGEGFCLEGTLLRVENGNIVLTLNHEKYSEIALFIADGSLQAEVTFPCEDEELSEEDERFVVLWLRSVKEYLRMYLKDTLYSRFSRYIMNRITLQMTPSQRKISLMLIRFTVVEILVIVFIVIGYVIFVLK